MNVMVFSLLTAIIGILSEDAQAHIGDRRYLIYEIPDADLSDIDLRDASITDWEDIVGDPSLLATDFYADPTVGEGAQYDPADLDYRIWLGWNGNSNTLHMAMERVDDVYINEYAGGDLGQLWRHDAIEFMVDGNHTGGDYTGSANENWTSAQQKLNNNRTAQQYVAVADTPDGRHVGYQGAGAEWVNALPYADGGGGSYGYGPTTSIFEFYVTPFDDLIWNSPDDSQATNLVDGDIIGFQISVPDFDIEPSNYRAFHTLTGQAATWRYAERFADGLLVGVGGNTTTSGPNTVANNANGNSEVKTAGDLGIVGIDLILSSPTSFDDSFFLSTMVFKEDEKNDFYSWLGEGLIGYDPTGNQMRSSDYYDYGFTSNETAYSSLPIGYNYFSSSDPNAPVSISEYAGMGMVPLEKDDSFVGVDRYDQYVNGVSFNVVAIRFFMEDGTELDIPWQAGFSPVVDHDQIGFSLNEVFSLSAGEISSSSHPEFMEWYAENVIYFNWDAVPAADYYVWQVVPKGSGLDVEGQGEVTLDIFANSEVLDDGEYTVGVGALIGNDYQSIGKQVFRIDTKVELPKALWLGEDSAYELDSNDGEKQKYYTSKTDSVYIWLDAEGLEADGSGFDIAYVSVSQDPSDQPVVSDDTVVQMLDSETITYSYDCSPGGIYVTNNDPNETFRVDSPVDISMNPQMRFSYKMTGSHASYANGLWAFDSYGDLPSGLTDFYLGDGASGYMRDAFFYVVNGSGTSVWRETEYLNFILASSTSSNRNICVTEVETKFSTLNNHMVSISGLASGRNYIHVSTRDKAGNRSENGYWVLDVDADPPSAVTNVVARSYSSGDVLLTWPKVTDDQSGLAKYRIYRSTRAGELGSLVDSTTALRYRDLSRSNGGSIIADLEYYYTLRAVDALGNENTSSANVQVGSKSSLPLPSEDSVTLVSDGRISSDTDFTLSFRGSFPSDGSTLTLTESTVEGKYLVLYVETAWDEEVRTTGWNVETSFDGLPEGSYNVRLIANEDYAIARFDFDVVGLPGIVVESTSLQTTPDRPTVSDEVSLSISGQLPSADASVSDASVISVTDSLVVVNIQTQWDADTGSVDAVDFEEELNLGFLQVGDYDLALYVDGLEVSRSSLEVLAGPPPEGPVSIDFDSNDGDQGQRLAKGAREGREYTLDLNVADVEAIKGWNVTVSYDPTMIEYVVGSFTPSSFIPGLIGLEDLSKTDRISVGGTTLGTSGQGEGSGSLGQVKFKVLDGFSGQTSIEIVEVALRPIEGDQIKFEVLHVVTLSDEADLVGDGNGDGIVNFDDFFLFADAFGGTDPAFDFNGSGSVDFDDFFIFADNFGKEAQAKLIAMAHEMIGLPKESGLFANYPNPFNMETTIPYQIMQEGEYLVAIYNTTGQLVRTLHSGFIPYGLHTLSWNGLDDQAQPVSSGVYLISLLGKDTRDLRKLMLLK